MEKRQIFVLIDEQRATNAARYLADLPVDGTMEVQFREVKKDKTLKQLGAVFGLWIKYLAENLGESEDSIHRMLKARFLARIYIIDPMTEAQEQWVELLAFYQDAGEAVKLKKHARRISLSWAKLKQMKAYMEAIESHYQAEGMPLPIPDKYWKHVARKLYL